MMAPAAIMISPMSQLSVSRVSGMPETDRFPNGTDDGMYHGIHVNVASRIHAIAAPSTC